MEVQVLQGVNSVALYAVGVLEDCIRQITLRSSALRWLIEQIVGSNVEIIDTSAVATQLQKKLPEANLLSANKQADIGFWTNSQAENAVQVIEDLWGAKVEIKCL